MFTQITIPLEIPSKISIRNLTLMRPDHSPYNNRQRNFLASRAPPIPWELLASALLVSLTKSFFSISVVFSELSHSPCGMALSQHCAMARRGRLIW